MIQRREMFVGLSGVLMLPAIVQAKNIMPIRPMLIDVQFLRHATSLIHEFIDVAETFQAMMQEEYSSLLIPPNMDRVEEELNRFDEKMIAVTRVVTKIARGI